MLSQTETDPAKTDSVRGPFFLTKVRSCLLLFAKDNIKAVILGLLVLLHNFVTALRQTRIKVAQTALLKAFI